MILLHENHRWCDVNIVKLHWFKSHLPICWCRYIICPLKTLQSVRNLRFKCRIIASSSIKLPVHGQRTKFQVFPVVNCKLYGLYHLIVKITAVWFCWLSSFVASSTVKCVLVKPSILGCLFEQSIPQECRESEYLERFSYFLFIN